MPSAHWVLNCRGVLDFLRGVQRLLQGLGGGNGAGTNQPCFQSSPASLYVIMMFYYRSFLKKWDAKYTLKTTLKEESDLSVWSCTWLCSIDCAWDNKFVNKIETLLSAFALCLTEVLQELIDSLRTERRSKSFTEMHTLKCPKESLSFFPSDLLRGCFPHPQTFIECLLATKYFQTHDFFQLCNNPSEGDTIIPVYQWGGRWC